MNVTDNRKIVNKGSYDIIVVGAGIAGISAAVSAARQDMSVILLEKNVNMGGLATIGLISWYEPLCDGKGNKMIGGMAEELIKLCSKYSFDNLPEKWGGCGKAEKRNDRYSTFYSPTIYELTLNEFVTDNNVNIRFDTLAVYPNMDNNHCNGVIAETVSGKEYYQGKVIIDATGTACIASAANMPTVQGENYMTYICHMYDMEGLHKCNTDKNTCAFRSWHNAGSDMNGIGQPDGMGKVSGDSSDDVTNYVLTGKKMLLNKLKSKDRFDYDVMALPDMPQFRTIKRIVGKTDFNAVDGQQFDDNIGNCGDFRFGEYLGNHYQIPFGSLYNEKFDNILAAGRIISAPKGNGWEVARVIPVCALTGQAAGNAAAICVKDKKSINDIRIDKLQKMQLNSKVCI